LLEILRYLAWRVILRREILRYLAWRAVKERGEDDRLKLEEVLGPS
jgi:hypothetical protein